MKSINHTNKLEDVFILNAARLHLSDENIFNLKEASHGIDWASFEKKVCKHGVDTFIYYSLKNHNLAHLVPSDTFKRFQDNFYRNAIRNTTFIEEINKLSEIIQDKIVLLKGADLMQSLYPNIALRTMGDVDFLVEKEKIEDIWKQLQCCGFIFVEHGKPIYKSSTHERNASKNKSNTLHSYPEHLPGLHNNRCCIEVHWNIFKNEEHYYITKKGWDKAVPIDEKKRIYRLSTEFSLVHLCSHFYAHKDRLIPLRMFCDINELICKYSDSINWEEINGICSDPVLRTRVVMALTYAHLLLKTPVPDYFINEDIVCDQRINLDTMLKIVHVVPPSSFFPGITSLDNHFDKLVFIFRTIVPVKKWIIANYGNHSGIVLPGGYCKYWLYLLRRYVLKQKIGYAN